MSHTYYLKNKIRRVSTLSFISNTFYSFIKYEKVEKTTNVINTINLKVTGNCACYGHTGKRKESVDNSSQFALKGTSVIDAIALTHQRNR